MLYFLHRQNNSCSNAKIRKTQISIVKKEGLSLRENCPYSEFLFPIQSEYGKIRARKTRNTNTFHGVYSISGTFLSPFQLFSQCSSDSLKAALFQVFSYNLQNFFQSSSGLR